VSATEDVHQDIEPLAVAKILAGVVQEEQPGLVLCGKQAIDNDMNATGQMLAALLGWARPPSPPSSRWRATAPPVVREVDGGLQAIRVRLPAIVTVDLRMNEPRYASLPNIMKAKKKPLEEKTPRLRRGRVTPASRWCAHRAQGPRRGRDGQVGGRSSWTYEGRGPRLRSPS
jgi:electron transfer flavoprotein beta subunit